MSRKRAVQADNKFIRGLITDTTALNFPEDACTDLDNCVLTHIGRVTRRPGFEWEAVSPTATTLTVTSPSAYTEYIWETSKGVERKTFTVVQFGKFIEFYDNSSSILIGSNRESTYQIDLSDYLPEVSYFDPNEYPCQYATGNNQLIIVNKATQPILVTYSDSSDTITISSIILYERDFDGVDDGLDLYERVTESVASLKTNNPEHYYNLLNQGWHIGDALAQWDSGLTTMPSNADQVGFFRASETDAFDSARVSAYSAVLNTPAPKGHFILEVGNYSRTSAMTTEGFTGATISDESVMIAAGTGTIIHNASSQQANAFDGTTNQAQAACATWGAASALNQYIGKTYAPAERIGYCVIYSPNNVGFTGATGNYVSFSLYGKTGTAPANATDGTLLGTSTSVRGDSSSQVLTIGCNDTTTEWDHVWVTRATSISTAMYLAEVQFFSNNNNTSYSRPDTVAFFAGRAWYAGMEDGQYNNKVYFSQIILKDEDYGKCYQRNDPTSEFLSEVLPDDGGYIKIAEAARILKLFAYQNSILVFATNGIWRISGFTATDYSVRKISSVNLESIFSIISVKGIPLWWSEDGIYTIQYEANFDAFSVQSLTDDKIKNFYLTIPRKNRKYVKGAYNQNNDTVIWLFNSDTSLADADVYSYDRALVMSTRTSAFYPWTFNLPTSQSLRGLFYIQDTNRTADPVIKYIFATSSNAYYAELKNETPFVDWEDLAYEAEYDSYFITGYKIHGDGQRFGQMNYITVYSDTLENSSCYVQGLFEFTNSGSSGRWSTPQQIYNPNITYQDNNTRRLKIRGKGHALQLKFQSDGVYPFSIIGWVIAESQNSDL